MTLYYMGAFTPVIWLTIVWTEKFNNGLCTHFLGLHGLKSSRNSSRLKIAGVNKGLIQVSLIQLTNFSNLVNFITSVIPTYD